MRPAVTYRPYDESLDREQVIEMCKNVDGGRDYLPGVLTPFHEDPSCRARAALVGNDVVAFCNARVLTKEYDLQDVVFLEGVRVAETERRRGFGRYIVSQTVETVSRDMMACTDEHDALDRQVRFLSVTIDENVAMQGVFEQIGWALFARACIWPSSDVVDALCKPSVGTKVQLLEALQISDLVPEHAKQAVPYWVQTTCPEEILRTMQELRQRGASYLLPKYYALETATGASKFLQTKYCDTEQRAVWRLARPEKPPILLFTQVFNKEPTLGIMPDQSLSACVVDREGVECCVAFAESRAELGYFRITFDPAISREDIQASQFLSKIATEEYYIYETRR